MILPLSMRITRVAYLTKALVVSDKHRSDVFLFAGADQCLHDFVRCFRIEVAR
jgi:hypothetical protein